MHTISPQKHCHQSPKHLRDKYALTAVPCNRAVSAITKAKLRPEDFVHDVFKKPMYLAAYNPIIFPVPGQDLWPKTNSRDIEPPVFKDKPGKKQTKRRRSQFEPPAPKDTSRMASITCSNCQLVGHRYTSCKQPLKLGLALRKNKHQVCTSTRLSQTLFSNTRMY